MPAVKKKKVSNLLYTWNNPRNLKMFKTVVKIVLQPLHFGDVSTY